MAFWERSFFWWAKMTGTIVQNFSWVILFHARNYAEPLHLFKNICSKNIFVFNHLFWEHFIKLLLFEQHLLLQHFLLQWNLLWGIFNTMKSIMRHLKNLYGSIDIRSNDIVLGQVALENMLLEQKWHLIQQSRIIDQGIMFAKNPLQPGKTNWRGRLSTVDLPIKVGCFVKSKKMSAFSKAA